MAAIFTQLVLWSHCVSHFSSTLCVFVCVCVCLREYRCRFTNTDTMLFCMRVMVGVIILYDHVHPVGAFAKTSKIDVSKHK